MLTLKAFLAQEVKPALGCTEPAAVALATARANEELPPESLVSIEVTVSDNIYKNGMAVVVPGTQGARGNAIAAALGVLCGKSAYNLEVLKDCTPKDVVVAKRWVQEGRVSIHCDGTKHGVYVKARVTRGKNWASALILDEHTNVTEVVRDGVLIFTKVCPHTEKEQSFMDVIGNLSYAEVIALAEEMDEADAEYLLKGVHMNMEIARFGLLQKEDDGFSFGQRMQKIFGKEKAISDLGYSIRMLCHAAADARMSGVKLPVMSSAGSGNHGITAILPVAIVGERLRKSPWEIAKALAISHLSTSFVKSRLGRLSKVCGCVIAAGAGAAAGITYLLGGNTHEMEEAMRILIADTAGMICDGAKESCSLKVGTGAFEAYLAALFAMAGSRASIPQGILCPSIEETVQNVARIDQEGMQGLDEVIINILEHCRLWYNGPENGTRRQRPSGKSQKCSSPP